MITVWKDSDNMMLVVKLVVVFVVNFAMVKVVIKGVEEHPDIRSLFCLFVMITGCKDSDNIMLMVELVVGKNYFSLTKVHTSI